MSDREYAARQLDFFVGTWQAVGRVEPGAFGPGGPSHGETTYRWELGGAWLTYYSRLQLPGLGAYEVRGGVAVAGDAGYRAFAFNNLGALLIYAGQWTTPAVLRFDATHPSSAADTQRVVYAKPPGGQIGMRSEKRGPDGAFVPYFAITLSRET